MGVIPLKKFSNGDLFIIGLGPNPTPIQVGVIQGINMKASQEVVRLTGANAFPEAVAGGPSTLSGDFEHGTLDPDIVSKVLTGSAVTTGYKKAHKATATIPGTPYQLTSAQAAGFARDLGVVFADTGERLDRVASAPAAGQYSVAAGVYTFAAADTGKSVTYRHTYTIAGTGKTVAITNSLLAAPTKYLLGIYNDGDGFGLEVRSVMILGLDLAMKSGAWVLPKMEWEASSDSANGVMDVYFP